MVGCLCTIEGQGGGEEEGEPLDREASLMPIKGEESGRRFGGSDCSLT